MKEVGGAYLVANFADVPGGDQHQLEQMLANVRDGGSRFDALGLPEVVFEVEQRAGIAGQFGRCRSWRAG